jgi:hypothetical protein
MGLIDPLIGRYHTNIKCINKLELSPTHCHQHPNTIILNTHEKCLISTPSIKTKDKHFYGAEDVSQPLLLPFFLQSTCLSLTYLALNSYQKNSFPFKGMSNLIRFLPPIECARLRPRKIIVKHSALSQALEVAPETCFELFRHNSRLLSSWSLRKNSSWLATASESC